MRDAWLEILSQVGGGDRHFMSTDWTPAPGGDAVSKEASQTRDYRVAASINKGCATHGAARLDPSLAQRTCSFRMTIVQHHYTINSRVRVRRRGRGLAWRGLQSAQAGR